MKWICKLADLTRGLVSNLTAYPGLESDPQWSPDERRLAFTSNRGGLWAPYMKDLVTGQEERLIEAKVNFAVDQWTHDGRYLIVRHMGHTMFALPTSGERKLQRLTEIRSGADQSQVSPDAEWIAFDSSIDGKPEVFVARFPALTDKKRISVAGGVQARWRHDSRELYYAAPDGNMMAVEVTRDRQMPFLAPRPLFKATFPEPGPDPEISQYRRLRGWKAFSDSGTQTGAVRRLYVSSQLESGAEELDPKTSQSKIPASPHDSQDTGKGRPTPSDSGSSGR